MAEENIEIVRRFFDAYNRGDFEATLDLIAPEFEFRPSGLFMDTESTYHGPEGWFEFWSTFQAAWESITVDLERIEDLGDQALTLGTFHGKGPRERCRSDARGRVAWNAPRWDARAEPDIRGLG